MKSSTSAKIINNNKDISAPYGSRKVLFTKENDNWDVQILLSGPDNPKVTLDAETRSQLISSLENTSILRNQQENYLAVLPKISVGLKESWTLPPSSFELFLKPDANEEIKIDLEKSSGIFSFDSLEDEIAYITGNIFIFAKGKIAEVATYDLTLSLKFEIEIGLDIGHVLRWKMEGETHLKRKQLVEKSEIHADGSILAELNYLFKVDND